MLGYPLGLALNQMGIAKYIFTHALQHKLFLMLGGSEQKSMVNVSIAQRR